MDESLFYTYQYHSITNVFKEEAFFNKLNQANELIKIVDEFIIKVKNSIYQNINTEPFNPESYEIVQYDLTEIIKQLTTTLEQNKLVPESLNLTQLNRQAIEKFQGRISQKDRLNKEGYVFQSYVSLWLESRLASFVCEDDRFSSPSKIELLLNQCELLFTFYRVFKKAVPGTWINNNLDEWLKLPQSTSDILRGITTYERNFFNDYETNLVNYNQENKMQYILDTTRNSDAAHLSSFFTIKSSAILKNSVANWVIFWDNLRLPVLQSIVIFYINDPAELLNISNQLTRCKSNTQSDPAHLSLILLFHILDSGISTFERLSFFENNPNLKEGDSEYNAILFEQGKSLKEKWDTSRDTFYSKVLEDASKILDLKTLTDFVFHRPVRAGRAGQYSNSEVQALQNGFRHIFSQQLTIQGDLTSLASDLNLSKFNFLLSSIKSQEIDDQKIDQILFALLNFSGSKSFYWNNTFEEPYWTALKGIGFLISKKSNTESTIKEILAQVIINHEGWNIKDQDYYESQQELFWLCGMIMIFEHSETFSSDAEAKVFFKFFRNTIIRQARHCTINPQRYLAPLYLTYLIVTQIILEEKEEFETELIEQIDDLENVLLVLASTETEISAHAKSLLEKRIENELKFQLKKIHQKGMKNPYKELLVKLNL